jgi:hypothetical protein
MLFFTHFLVEGYLDLIELFPSASDGHRMFTTIIQELGGHKTAL